jgi:hypothetical protein
MVPLRRHNSVHIVQRRPPLLFTSSTGVTHENMAWSIIVFNWTQHIALLPAARPEWLVAKRQGVRALPRRGIE